MGYTPRVLVVGGGATGAAVARDLAMRGLEVTLLDRGPLASGATGRSPGLLHSGARFAASNPDVATRYHTETERLRTIASHCVDETGGLIAALPGDGGHLERTREACEAAGIDVEGLDADGVQKLEPRLSTDVEGGLFVPDAAADPFRLTVATAASAREYGASIETHAAVTGVLIEDGAVRGVEVRLDDVGEHEELRVDYVVNAAGPWAGQVGALAGLEVPLARSTATGLVVNERPTEAVVTRPRSDGGRDTIVPFDRRCVLEVTGEGPDDVAVDAPLADLSALVAGLSAARPLRSFRGMRATLDADAEMDDGVTGLTSGYHVIDHEQRDGLWGISTVVGSPVALSRLAAEAVTDQVCEKFGIARGCLTGQHALPGSESEPDVGAVAQEFGLDRTVASRAADRLGGRAREVLGATDPNPVVCACESVTRAEIQNAIDEGRGDPTDLDAVRIRTRAGMGECQGARCCHRVATELYPSQGLSAVDAGLDEFVRSRWSGWQRALWGDQLAAAMEGYALHATTMNRDTERGEIDLDAFDSGPAPESAGANGGDAS
ncbi:MAG: FAD-dependent oxidoreductase [Haloarculaceae archaeon]